MQNDFIQWHIGCSGFHYKEWQKAFYPDGLSPKKWFEFYCEHFNDLELNVTFYRFPELASLQNWYQKSPAQFCFSVKAPRLITHYKKFENTKQQLNDFYSVVQNGLQEKLGCILFQLPPQLVYDEALLNNILHQLDSSFTNVLEFRHSSWWRQEVYDALVRTNSCFCSISYPHLPDAVVAGGDTVYYRFHGVPQLYNSAYDKSFLQKVVADCKSISGMKRVFLLFNNTAQLAAIRNARYLQKSLALSV